MSWKWYLMNCCHPISEVVGLTGLFMMGLSGSLHCIGMCGPITTVLSGNASPSLWRYHVGRLFSYSLLGAAVGSVKLVFFSPSPFWTMAIILPLLIYASGLSFPIPAALQNLQRRLLRLIYRIPPVKRTLAMGLLTPLLPCGLLYGALAAATAAPTPLSAAAWMAAFAMGTMPLLWLGQRGIRIAAGTREGKWLKPIMRLLALAGALFLGWMMIG